MRLRALAIYLGERLVGRLFHVEPANASPVLRFVADDAFARDPDQPCLSLSLLADRPEEQSALWAGVASPQFNAAYSARYGWLLPPFFQNLLPEGVFRDQIAVLRHCAPTDHFDMLAACGLDLPGNVRAIPIHPGEQDIAALFFQSRESAELATVAAPLDEGVSLSGVQPKLGVLREGDRYVGRTKLMDTHVIAKLPVVGYPRLPEVEALSLRLAAAAGVDVCEATLEPLSRLAAEHHYDLGDEGQKAQFLAVQRFDRSPAGRIHGEDFAQVLSMAPEAKYSASYLDVARVLRGMPSLGEAAVHELLRRILVNELLGNPDMHLKNIGVRYPDGRTPVLSPAYDVVAYSAFNARAGHALHILPPAVMDKPRMRAPEPGEARAAKPHLSPRVLRAFCEALDLPEKPAQKMLRDTVRQAMSSWPAMIRASGLTDHQKQRLTRHFLDCDKVQALAKRSAPGV